MSCLKLPVVFINFKTYRESTGKNALDLAKKAEAVSMQYGVSIVLVVQAIDLREIANAVKIPVFAQHIDPVVYGSFTGHILPEAVKDAGAIGTVLNHAENKRDNDFLQKAISRAKDAGLNVMVCAESIERAKQIASFAQKPDLIAVEPPELIGGNISVSTAQPGLISDSVKAIHAISNIPVIVGAGIKNSNDVRKSIELGSAGVFVASGIIKAPDSKKAIEDLASGFK